MFKLLCARGSEGGLPPTVKLLGDPGSKAGFPPMFKPLGAARRR
jgi:hypothetical protein